MGGRGGDVGVLRRCPAAGPLPLQHLLAPRLLPEPAAGPRGPRRWGGPCAAHAPGGLGALLVALAACARSPGRAAGHHRTLRLCVLAESSCAWAFGRSRFA